MAPIPKQTQHWSWVIAAGIATLLLGWLLRLGWLFSSNPDDKYLTMALLIGCGATGWVVGTALSPDSTTEARKMSAVWKGISLFASGYLISKVDRLIAAILLPDLILHPTEHLAAFRFVAGVSSVFLSAIMTYMVRIYGLTVGEK